MIQIVRILGLAVIIVQQAKAATTITVASSPQPATVGQPISITATVVPATATGNVTFYDGSGLLGIVGLVKGSSTLSTSQLGAGVHSLQARYNGDSSNIAKLSSVLPISVKAYAGGGFSRMGIADVPFVSSVVLADLNLDGIVDLVSTDASLVRVMVGVGDGTFSAAAAYSVSPGLQAAAVGDFNGDGIPDVAAVAFGDQSTVPVTPATVNILLGNGDGTLRPSLITVAPTAAFQVVISDFNRDGKADVALANLNTNDVSVFIGKGDGSFLTVTTYATGASVGAYGITAGDFNGDGNIDLAVAEDKVAILLGKPNGTFGIGTRVSAGSSPNDVQAADLNGDGKLDLVVANLWDATVTVALGNGDGTFQGSIPYQVQANPSFIQVGDFSGDGFLDLAVANAWDGTRGSISVLVGDGLGGFQPQVVFASGPGTATLSKGDLNRDGIEDLVTADFGSGVSSFGDVGVFVSPPCVSLNPKSMLVGSKASSVVVVATAFNWCLGELSGIAAVSDQSWLVVSGVGVGTVTLSVQANTSALQRIGHVTVQRQQVTITQSGDAPNAIVKVAGDPQSAYAGMGFAVGLQVLVTDGASKPLQSASVQFTVAPAGNGAGAAFAGSGLIVTDGNGMATAPPLTANSILGSFQVTATVGTATTAFNLTNIALSCSYSASPGSLVFGSPGGSGNIQVTANSASCPWSGTAISDQPWVVISGVSLGTVSLSVQPNTSVMPRTGHVTVQGQQVTITQSGDAPNAIVKVAGDPQSAYAGMGFAVGLQVLVTDGASKPLQSASVQFTVAPAGNGAGAAFAGSGLIVTDGNGMATAPPLTANSILGSFQVTATVGTATTAFNLTNIALSCSYSASPGSLVFGSPGGSGNIQVTANSASCPWSGTAISDQPWVVISGVSLGTVSLSVQPNTSVMPRTGHVTVQGQQVTITQSGDAPNAIVKVAGDPQSAYAGMGFAVGLQVLVTDGASKPLQSASVQFTVAPAGNGAGAAFAGSGLIVTDGNGMATAPPLTANSILGSFQVTATVGTATTAFNLTNIALSCSYSASPGSLVFGSPGGSGNIQVTANSASCPWSGTAISDQPWVVISGVSLGTVSLSVQPNTSVMPRTGHVTVQGQQVTITQSGDAPNAIVKVAGDPQSAYAGMGFAVGLQVLVTDGASKPLQSASVQFTVAPAGNGAGAAFAGSGLIVTDGNGMATAPPLTANSILGSFQVTATVGTATTAFNLTNIALSCSYSASPGSLVFGSPGGSGNIQVTANSASCPWSGTAISDQPWVVISGVSLGTVSLSVQPNTSVMPRTGHVTVQGQQVTITQSGDAPNAIVKVAGDPQSAYAGMGFAVGLQVLVTDGASKPLQSASVQFTVAPAGNGAGAAFAGSGLIVTDGNGMATAPPLTANSILGSFQVTATVGTATTAFNLTNIALSCSYSASPGSLVFGSPGGSGNIQVTANSASCPWSGTAISDQPWVVISGVSLGTVSLSVQPNTSVMPRTGHVTVQGQQVTITQSGDAPNAIVKVAGDPQSAYAGMGFAVGLQVLVTDGASKPLQSASVQFTVAPAGNGAGAAFAGSGLIVTDGNGMATAPPLTANSILGSFQVTATVGTATTAFNLTNIALSCSYSASPGSLVFGSPGGSGNIQVTANSASCPWSGTAISDQPWVVISGVSLGTVSLSVQPNTSVMPRTGHVTVQGQQVTITQSGDAPNAIVKVAGDPQSAYAGMGFAVGLQVLVTDGASKPLQSASVQFTVAPAGNGAGAAFAGSGLIVTDGNGMATAPPLTANSILGSFQVTATVGTATTAFNLTNIALSCSYSASPGSLVFGSPGGSGNIQVTANSASCPWSGTAISDQPWVVISGVSLGTVSLSVQPNTSVMPRTGHVTVQGQQVTITQSGDAPNAISSLGVLTLSAVAGQELSGPIKVLLLDSVSQPVSGAGITFTVTTGPTGAGGVFGSMGISMTGSDGIASSPPLALNSVPGSFGITATSASGLAVTVTITSTSTSCIYSLSASEVLVDNAGGSSTLLVSRTPSTCSWSAASALGWVTITSMPVGAGSVTLAITPNSTGFERSGSVLIAGSALSIRQKSTSQVFSDVDPTAYYFDAVNLLAGKHITSGCGPGLYCPDMLITRAQMAVFLIRSILGTDTFVFSSTPYFNDVPTGSFGFAWIQKLYELGITSGCAGGNFCPTSTVTRDQMAVFIIRARYGAGSTIRSLTPQVFDDVPPGAFAYDYIQWMALDNITSGCGTRLYCPLSAVTRGAMALFIMKGAFNQLLPMTQPVISSISPGVIPIGSGTTVTVLGYNTHFTPSTTRVNPVTGISLSNLQVISPTQLTVTMTPNQNNGSAPSSIWVTSGLEQAVLPNSLWVQ